MREYGIMRVRGAGRVAFLALRPVIATELAAGWPMAEVFRRHQAEFGVQVGQFRAYVKRYVDPAQRWTGACAAAAPRHPVGQPQARGPDLTTGDFRLSTVHRRPCRSADVAKRFCRAFAVRKVSIR